MSTNDGPKRRPRVNGLAVVLLLSVGVVLFIVSAVQGDPLHGLVAFGIAAILSGALIIFSRKSDTVALLGDDIHEERNVHIHQRASIYTLNIVAVAMIVGFVVNVARGGDGGAYAMLAAFTGVVYVGSLLILNRRS